MAHYALLDNNNKVIQVIVGIDETENPNAEEFYSNIYGVPVKRTSYNTYANNHIAGGLPFRKNFAAIGFTYDSELDAFLPPKPFPSWILNLTTYTWDPPIPYPKTDDEFIVKNLSAEHPEFTKLSPDSEYRPSNYDHRSEIHQKRFLPDVIISDLVKDEVQTIPPVYAWNENIKNWAQIFPPT